MAAHGPQIYRCPKCGEVIRADELIAEEDDGPGDAALLAAPPPKHLTVKTEIDGVTPVTTLRYRRVHPAIIIFLPFTCVWSGFSLAGIYGSQIAKRAFDLKLSLFGIPFLIGSIVLVSVAFFMLCGKRVLTLSAGKGSCFTGVGPFGWTRRFTYNRDTEVKTGLTYGNSRNSGPQHCLDLFVEGRRTPVRLLAGCDEDALEYVAAVIRRECRRA